ncbi:hypothetical protein FRC11_005366, partial [Ceratobasidium sp. 423]
ATTLGLSRNAEPNLTSPDAQRHSYHSSTSPCTLSGNIWSIFGPSLTYFPLPPITLSSPFIPLPPPLPLTFTHNRLGPDSRFADLGLVSQTAKQNSRVHSQQIRKDQQNLLDRL